MNCFPPTASFLLDMMAQDQSKYKDGQMLLIDIISMLIQWTELGNVHISKLILILWTGRVILRQDFAVQL